MNAAPPPAYRRLKLLIRVGVSGEAGGNGNNGNAKYFGVRCTNFHWHVGDPFMPVGAIHEPRPSKYPKPDGKVWAIRWRRVCCVEDV